MTCKYCGKPFSQGQHLNEDTGELLCDVITTPEDELYKKAWAQVGQKGRS